MTRRFFSSLVVLLAAGALVPSAAASGQQPKLSPAQQLLTETRGLYESGKDQEVIAKLSAPNVPPDTRAQLLFLAAQSQQRLRQSAQAKQSYAQLAARPETDPWRFVGLAGVAIAERRFDAAVAAATRATTMAPTLAQAHFQLGLTQGYKQDFAKAAAAFVQATTLDPTFAYAHYNAGLSFQRVRRVDLTARHFESFLRLAPQAPERPMVESIMRTIRG